MTAVFSHNMPLFPDDPPYQPSRPIETASLTDTGFQSLVASSDLNAPIIGIVEELFSLTREVLRLRNVRLTPEERKSTTSRRARVERALYTTQFDSFSRGGEIQHCIRLAALIYACFVYRRMPTGSAILSGFAKQLQFELEKTKEFIMWEGRLESILWISFLGGVAVPVWDNVRKSWYTSWLATLCEQLRIYEWDKILNILERYLWSEEDLKHCCKSLWSNVVINIICV